MVRITTKSPQPGNNWLVILEEETGIKDLWNVDPGSNRWGVRTGVFLVSDDWLNNTDLSRIHLNVVLSHEGNEEDRICYPDGEPYIDNFGYYVYTISTIGHVLKGRRDQDLRLDLSQPLPREFPYEERYAPAGIIT